MVRLVAFGVRQPGCLKLGPIDIAASDARRLYRAVQLACGATFDALASCCVSDPTETEMHLLIKRLAAQSGAEDVLIIYFSGHGKLEASRLWLVCSDADPRGRGQITVPELREWLVTSPSRKVIILDCCQSGAALGLASAEDVYEKTRTAVVSSTETFGRSSFDVEGSEFTIGICRAVDRLYKERAPLSLKRIIELVRDTDIEQCGISIGDGQPDFVIPTAYESPNLPCTFCQDFVQKIVESAASQRQNLWFDLAAVPLLIRFQTLEEYFRRHARPSEPSWLVRRAIGTTLSSCEALGPDFEGLCTDLINSPDWMLACIGLVAARKYLSNAGLSERARNLLTRADRIELVWLAQLYLSDATVDALSDILRTKLLATPWGAVDIAARWLPPTEYQSVLDQIVGACQRQDVCTALGTYCRLHGLHSELADDLPCDSAVVSSDIANLLCKSDRRGPVLDPDLKSLSSALYGSWRDRLQCDIRTWLKNQSESVGIEQLGLASRIPSVDARMVVFQDLGHEPALVNEYESGLVWGLRDPHPWVRREAIWAFREQPAMASEALNGDLDMSLWPGALDLCLQAAQHGISVESALRSKQLVKSEREALSWAINLDSRRIEL